MDGVTKTSPIRWFTRQVLQQQGLGQAARQNPSRSPVGAITQVPGEEAE